MELSESAQKRIGAALANVGAAKSAPAPAATAPTAPAPAAKPAPAPAATAPGHTATAPGQADKASYGYVTGLEDVVMCNCPSCQQMRARQAAARRGR